MKTKYPIAPGSVVYYADAAGVEKSGVARQLGLFPGDRVGFLVGTRPLDLHEPAGSAAGVAGEETEWVMEEQLR